MKHKKQITLYKNTKINSSVIIIGLIISVNASAELKKQKQNVKTSSFSVVSGFSDDLSAGSLSNSDNKNIAIGDNAEALGNNFNSIAIGNNSKANETGATSIGFGANAGQYSTAIGIDSNAVNNSSAFGDRASAIGESSTALGSGSEALTYQSLAIGNFSQSTGDEATSVGALSQASGDYALSVGTRASASGKNSIALGHDASATFDNSVAIGKNSRTDRDNSVSFGDIGSEKQLTNIAAGTQETDAVNKHQLDIVEKKADNSYIRAEQAESNANQYTDMKIEDSHVMINNNINNSKKEVLSVSNNYTDQRFGMLQDEMYFNLNKLDEKIDQVKKQANAGVAGAIAMSSIPYKSDTDFSAGLALGQYRNGSAIAGGIQYNINQQVSVRGNISWNNNDSSGAGIGLSVGW